MSIRVQFLLNLIFAWGYFAGGYLGTILAMPPSNASPVWPAAGVALAGFLLYGPKLLPGIFLGALAAQVYAFLDISNLDKVLVSVLVGSVAALGACLQGLFGAALIKRFVGVHDPLVEDKKILRFFVLAGPISCIVSPSLGIAVLYLRRIIVSGDLLASWGTWWIGDTIGVVIFTPLILLFFNKSHNFWKSRRKYIVYPLVTLLIVVVSVFEYGKRLEHERISSEFHLQVMRLHGALRKQLEYHSETGRILKGFFESSQQIEYDEFQNFAEHFLTRNRSVQALEWIPRVYQAERTRLKEQEQFVIREPDSNRDMIEAGYRPEYFPIYYVVPQKNNERAEGFDIASNSSVRSLIAKVIDSGRTLATKGIQLVQDKDSKYGIVLYTPVYQRAVSLETPALKRTYFRGFVACVFHVEDLLGEVLRQVSDVELRVIVRDDDQLLFRSAVNDNSHQLDFIKLEEVHAVELGGRNWQVVYRPAPGFYSDQKNWAIWWLLLGGMIITSLIGLGLMLLTGRAARVEELVAIKTRDLEKTNRHLNDEMAKRQKLQIEQISRNKVLEQLAHGDTLSDVLHLVARNVEQQYPNMWCSILLLDPNKQCLHNGASPSLPSRFVQAIEGTPAKEGMGACGTAAYKKETVIIEDTINHPYCRHFEVLLQQVNIRSCWSQPIISSKNTVLGTFGIYYRKPMPAQREHLQFIQRMAQLCAIAIERKNNESDLRIAATTFQSHEAIAVTDLNGTILRVNQAFTKITGYSEAEAIGQNPRILSSGYHDVEFYKEMFNILEEEGRWQGEIWNRRKNGEIYPEWLMITVVKNDHDEKSHYVAIFSDITEKKAAEKEIHDLAFYDPLTGLPNRRLFLDRLKHEIAVAKRHQRFGALFYLDLDHFKRLNDSLGHQIGDELLIQVSQRISTLLREDDTACRMGGDEFVVLVSGQENNPEHAADHAALLAEKIRETINQPFMLLGSPHHFSTSVGVSIYPDTSDQPEVVIQQADTAMYRAKESGRNSISFFRPKMQELADQRLILEKEMRQALSNSEFKLYYQPQVDRHGNVISAEALIRWLHPQKGMISPAVFIPVAEETQLILPIGEWVLHEACRQITQWERNGSDIDHVAINVSSRQFRQPDFIDQVKFALDDAGINGNRLMIELTEGVVIDNIEDTINKMQALKKMGIDVSIDDFGTGYSSLSYLKKLPISQLKIDQSFIRDIATDPNDAIIVETIINMAKNLGLNVIAEGVETQAQVDFLLANGCVAFQGFRFGRPVPAEAFSIKKIA